MDFNRIAAEVAAILAQRDGVQRCPEPQSGWCWDSAQNRVKIVHTRGGQFPITVTREPYRTGVEGTYLAVSVQPDLHLTADASPQQIANAVEEALSKSQSS